MQRILGPSLAFATVLVTAGTAAGEEPLRLASGRPDGMYWQVATGLSRTAESEIEAVRDRENRDRKMLESGTINAKQLGDLQHELETLERRQASLEDSLLEVMERREELQAQQSEELGTIDVLESELAEVQRARDDALAEIEQSRHQTASRREELVAGLDPELVALYERQRSRGGAGAGRLQGRRCGACRLEIDQGELARISAAADDEVLRCPECGAILLRVKDGGR